MNGGAKMKIFIDGVDIDLLERGVANKDFIRFPDVGWHHIIVQ